MHYSVHCSAGIEMLTGVTRVLEIVGSGEFLPWVREADRRVLDGAQSGDGSVVVVPTAIAPDGEDAFDRTGRMGVEHFAELGFPARFLPLRERADAFRDDLVLRLGDPSLIYLAGGRPEYLAATLAGTPFWAEVTEAVNRGVALAGCSAGAWVMGELVPDSRVTQLAEHSWEPGLRLLPRTVVAPHWDGLDGFIPGLQRHTGEVVAERWTLLPVEERTAIVGDGVRWKVFGSGAAHVRRGGRWWTFRPGFSLDLDSLSNGERPGLS